MESPKHPNSRSEFNGEKWQALIFAFLENELPPDNAKKFAAEIEQNPVLQQEVNRWREAIQSGKEWAKEEAPGIDRVETLAIPQLAAPVISFPEVLGQNRKSAWRWRRYAATAAVFALGFLFGLFAQKEVSILNHPPKSPYYAQPTKSGEGSIPARINVPTPATADSPKSTIPTPAKETSPRLASLPDTTITREENGKVIIETTLKSSGVRAIWVVDGKFDLKMNSQTQ